MPEPRYRSRSKIRKRVRVPGGKNKLHYKKSRPAAAKCARCKKPMYNIPRKNPSEMRKLSKVHRNPNQGVCTS